jgi:hypothetical protein
MKIERILCRWRDGDLSICRPYEGMERAILKIISTKKRFRYPPEKSPGGQMTFILPPG